MKVAIAIFVKTPGISPLKTRLAASIGKEKAEDFYRLSLQAITSTLKKVDITPYFAVGEIEGLNDTLWNDFDKLHTGDGNLGDRQNHVYKTLLKKYDAVILIGADAPQLSQSLINEAISELQSHDFVIGPAHDGGYYLLAGRKAIGSHVWADTPWSHDNTREILVSKLISKADRQVHQLKALTDVDVQSDLDLMLSEMPKDLNEGLNKNQEKLKNWIKLL